MSDLIVWYIIVACIVAGVGFICTACFLHDYKKSGSESDRHGLRNSFFMLLLSPVWPLAGGLLLGGFVFHAGKVALAPDLRRLKERL